MAPTPGGGGGGRIEGKEPDLVLLQGRIMLSDLGVVTGRCFPVLRVQDVDNLLPLSGPDGRLDCLDSTPGAGSQGRFTTPEPKRYIKRPSLGDFSLPGLNIMVDGCVQLLLLHQVVSPILLQLHHLSREDRACQLNGCKSNRANAILDLTALARPVQSAGAEEHVALGLAQTKVNGSLGLPFRKELPLR